MGLPVTGSWSASNQPYTGAQRWGTGVNPVHEVYGEGPPLRVTGRLPGPDDPSEGPSSVPSEIITPFEYGYTMDDIAALTPIGMPPGWDGETEEWRSTAGNHPAWAEEGEPFRAMSESGLDIPNPTPEIWSGIALQSFPTETVSEGWLNKESGTVSVARTSDPGQYEMQTSMQQVNPPAGRNNDAAVARGTDSPRFNILTRLTGKKIKPWSQGERNEDMFPYQQDVILRPFQYRTAGTADPNMMIPNSMYVNDPIQRDVPPDPNLGPEETSLNVYSLEAGYTSEDMTYA
jgi:hypothetical protein